ncbi:amidohydrolase [Arthrobacter pityocampae]|uniref:Amidohydrolase n=1 Tax=Arthrobacter pityocampae TaxID=547334 RepID=A0A2S5IYW3_9MICC|nr:amidohydrolase [Arthrobacter pityocampae]PPB49727.1 amidohydrolase [Arthrobacter pityocampae]
MPADLVLHNGRVFDGLSLHPTATAVAVAGDAIATVGTDAKVLAVTGPRTDVVDLRGRLLTPGFTDAHAHTFMGGIEALACNLEGHRGAGGVQRAVAAHAAGPGRNQDWITGAGWYKGDFDGGFPDARVLDAVVPHRPVHLINRDHHSAWVNTAALERAGIDARTPDPPDGRIGRRADGSPSGILHEGAMSLVARLLPPVTRATVEAGILYGQRHLHALGVTGWQEAIIGDYAGYPDAAPAYRSLAASGQLTGRATGALWVPRGLTLQDIPDLIGDFRERRRINAEAGFPTSSAKIMVDGVPENRTAALLEPYEPVGCDCVPASAADRGPTYLPPEVLDAVVAALQSARFDLHLHAIGDRAVRTGLDAVAHARTHVPSGGSWRPRHTMAHVQLVHPDDVPRFGELGVTVNAQALWACSDEQMRALTVPLIGEDRAQWQYPFASMLSGGAPLAMGSDWSVSDADPWQALHVAVNRTHPDHPGIPPLVPREALTLRAALSAYTAGSARVTRSTAGILRAGLPADLAVLTVDPFALEASELHTVAVDLTVAGGHVVFER